MITSQKKKHLFLIRSAKFRERIDAAVDSAQRASKYALQKADIAISRTATARGKAELADLAADHARVDSDIAIQTAREFAPDFKPSLLERFERIRVRERFRTVQDDLATNNIQLKPNEQLSPNQSSMPNNLSPNKTNLNPSMQQQLLAPQPSVRRPSTNPIPKQQTMDYSNMSSNSNYVSSNQSDYENSLHINQQFGQPQPPGNMYGTPKKQYSQQQQQGGYNQNSNSMMSQSSPHQNAMNTNFNQSQNQYQQQLNYQQSMQSSKAGMDPYSHHEIPNQQSSQQQQLNNPYSHDYSRSYGGDMQQSSNQANSNIRRNSKLVSDSGRPMLGSINQTSIDHFDHYKQPPSRDSSVDRYTRAASRMGGSRQPSVDRTIGNPQLLPESSLDRNVRASSQFRGTTPTSNSNINGNVLTGTGAASLGPNSRRGSRSGTPVFQQMPSTAMSQAQLQAQYSSPNQPFEDILLRQRTLGQDIIPSPGQPKRTESLYVPSKPSPKIMSGGTGLAMGGGGGGGGGGARRGLKVSKTKNAF